ncbi:hypothetical protein [Microbispora catharanthi]|uniref:Sigma-70 family RNA polymerase sigma factor n=1 Tax=Microbispora catharanthi TaxID=1712871 RepID=A0A5N6B4P1_9ACTN|nr:hypothetical protein [Microbispora catharanthi]KAB8175684.1 hypothetical protein FH610_039195 [Microbispora catharanthi]
MNDGVLVEALRARDPGALAALYDTYAGNLYRYCRTLLAGPDAAQVALRDTLIAAEALVGSLADPDRFRPWLYALARGECMRRRTPEEEDGPETGPVPVATVPFPGVTAEGAEADLRLVASSAVGALSAEDREVLELAARHGMTGQDLAGVLGTAERYAEALLDAATERLRETVTVEILARRATHDCPRASAILAGFTGELTAQARAQLTRHLARCETCARQRVRQISPAKVFGLLPQIALPETLRVRVLSSFIDPELVPYRRYVAKRVGGLNAGGFPRAGRREGRLAQAVAGAVAALAAVATIALVFAQFAGDLRERAADTIAPLRLPTAEAPAGPSGGTASPEGSSDEVDGVGGRSPVPSVSRELAEPVVPVVPARPVALPRPAPLPAPVPPSAGRPHRPAPHGKPSGRPTGAPSSQGPGTSPSGPTPTPTITPGTPSSPGTEPGEEPTPGGTGSGGPGSGGPGSGWPGSGGHGSGGPGPGWPPRGGPPPAHWPGHRPPWRDHQHHPRPHRECPPTPAPSRKPSGDDGGPTALPPWRGGHGARHEAQNAGGGGRAQNAEAGGRPQDASGWRGQGAGDGGPSRHARPGGPGQDGWRRDGSRRDGPGPGRPGRDGSLPGVPGGVRDGGSERGTERRGTSGDPASGSSGGPGGAFPV